MQMIKPIETQYNGLRFRSRLEARWAVFFDTLGVEYEYEPEGFELPSGARYLPDFRVKCYGTRGGAWGHGVESYGAEIIPFDLWVEVKGNMTQEDADRIIEFSNSATIGKDISYRRPNPVLILPNIPKDVDDALCTSYSDNREWFGATPLNYELIDGDWFGACPAAHEGKFYLFGADWNYINDSDASMTEIAFSKARQARFEYAEREME